jgi:HAD superfamily hydrolase (TIGR01484 family)
LDGTLCPVGKGVKEETLQSLLALEEKGYRIAICSGKPTYYLCGMARQLGLKAPILVGENGAVIQFGVDLPPRDYYVLPYAKDAKKAIRNMKDAIDEEYPDMWYQPNEVMLTPFPFREEQFDWIQDYIDNHENELSGLDIYRHADCFDIVPKGISKKDGLRYLGSLMQVSADEMVAVGDGVNDYPMFEYVGLALGIGLKEEEKVHHNFKDIMYVMKHLHEL